MKEKEEREKVEEIISQKQATEKIITAFELSNNEEILESLSLIANMSDKVSARLGESEVFMNLLLQRLSHPKSLVKRYLLETLRAIAQTVLLLFCFCFCFCFCFGINNEKK